MFSLEEEVGRLLKAKGWTLAVAESCTGGLISNRITDVPGSSAYFLGGFVTYGDSLKETVLGVGQNLLARHGAVSRAVVRDMARGARKVSGATIAAAVSGVAGPSGGSLRKPIGLVYLAVESPAGTKIAKYQFEGDRRAVRDQAAQAALGMLREVLLETGTG